MGLLDILSGGKVDVPADVKRLSDAELLRISRTNPYGWSVAKMAAVAQEIKNRGLN